MEERKKKWEKKKMKNTFKNLSCKFSFKQKKMIFNEI